MNRWFILFEWRYSATQTSVYIDYERLGPGVKQAAQRSETADKKVTWHKAGARAEGGINTKCRLWVREQHEWRRSA